MTFLLLGIAGAPIYALIALGFVFIFRVTKAYPLQQGALALLGSYLFLYFYSWTGKDLVLALILQLLAMGVISLVLGRVIFERMLGRHFPSLIAGFAILTIIEAVVAEYFFSGQAVSYPTALHPSGNVSILGTAVPTGSMIAFLGALFLTILLDIFARKTRQGLSMQAVADTPRGSRSSGIVFLRTVRLAFVIAGVTAGAAGLLIGISQSTISSDLTGVLTLNGLAAALLGGSTSLRGAMLAALIISIIESLAIGYVSSAFGEALTYCVVIAALVVRPAGLLGSEDTVRA